MKRKRSQQSCDKARKIFKIDGRDDVSTTTNGSLLRLYYPRVQSLRDYLLSQLPHASKRRRKLLVAVPIASGVPEGEQQAYTALRTLLDYTIVGSFDREPYVDSAKRQEEQNLFSQQVSESTGGTANIKAHTSMSEVGRATHCTSASRFYDRFDVDMAFNLIDSRLCNMEAVSKTPGGRQTASHIMPRPFAIRCM